MKMGPGVLEKNLQHFFFQKSQQKMLLVLTFTQISKHIVALLRKGDLVDGVTDVTGLQQIPCIFASFSTVNEAFNISVEPVHHL